MVYLETWIYAHPSDASRPESDGSTNKAHDGNVQPREEADSIRACFELTRKDPQALPEHAGFSLVCDVRLWLL